MRLHFEVNDKSKRKQYRAGRDEMTCDFKTILDIVILKVILVMAANKENRKQQEVNKLGRRDVLTSRKDEDNIQTVREPLRTLSSHQNQKNVDLAGPSHGFKVLDTRHVTHRHNDEELDWKFEVFKVTPREKKRKENDYSKQGLAKSMRKFEEIEARHTKEVVLTEAEEKKEQIMQVLNTGASEVFSTGRKKSEIQVYEVTPGITLKSPNEQALKKVKRSLKRPSSRSQTVPSPVSAKTCHCTIFSSRDISDPIPRSRETIDNLNQAYVQDNLYYMQQIERKIVEAPKIRSASRTCVINWIINVNGSTGNPLVVQLACWYLDYYLATTLVTVTRLQVIAAACFWIATKFHGRHISGRRLVKYSGNAFLETELVATEKHVLKKLKFQALPITPHEFVPYLSWRCDVTNTGVVEAAATFLCQTALLIDKTLCQEYASVVAVAAVKNALILLRQNVWIDRLKSCGVYQAAELKATDINQTCAQLRNAVRVVAAVGYEYKAPLFKFAGPPHYIANKMIRAVNYKDILRIDDKDRYIKRKTQ